MGKSLRGSWVLVRCQWFTTQWWSSQQQQSASRRWFLKANMDLKNVVLAKIYFWGDSRFGVLDLKIVVLAKTLNVLGDSRSGFFVVVFFDKSWGRVFGDVGFTSSQVGNFECQRSIQS